MVYGRRHTLVDCDEFTRNFLTAQGVDVNPSQPVPTDQFQEHRDKIEVGSKLNYENEYVFKVMFWRFWERPQSF